MNDQENKIYETGRKVGYIQGFTYALKLSIFIVIFLSAATIITFKHLLR